MKLIRRITKFLIKFFLWFFICSIGLVLLYKWVPVYVTPLMIIRSVEQKTQDEHIVWKHDWVPIEEISKNLQLAVICSEDQKFLTHNGFDFEAIEKAYKNNKTGGKIKGGSTISQQTAKNVFLWPQRSWLRKGLEAYFTFLIELMWSKERIMEVYLNSIEMGKGIYGAQAASMYWYKKYSSRLSPQESAAIASILPKPREYKAISNSSFMQNRKSWILRQMRYFGPLSYNLDSTIQK